MHEKAKKHYQFDSIQDMFVPFPTYLTHLQLNAHHFLLHLDYLQTPKFHIKHKTKIKLINKAKMNGLRYKIMQYYVLIKGL